MDDRPVPGPTESGLSADSPHFRRLTCGNTVKVAAGPPIHYPPLTWEYPRLSWPHPGQIRDGLTDPRRAMKAGHGMSQRTPEPRPAPACPSWCDREHEPTLGPVQVWQLHDRYTFEGYALDLGEDGGTDVTVSASWSERSHWRGWPRPTVEAGRPDLPWNHCASGPSVPSSPVVGNDVERL